MTKRVLLVTHRWSLACPEADWVEAIVASGGVTPMYVEDSWELPSNDSYDAVVFFVRFRELMQRDRLSWARFDGLRVLLDHDAFHDYGGWWDSPYIGQWRLHTRRLGFDLLVVSGDLSREHFVDLGFNCETIYKGYSSQRFFDLNKPREVDSLHYGSAYRARSAMIRRVRSAGIRVVSVEVPYEQLNAVLNEHLTALVCNMPSALRGGTLGRAVNKVLPGAALRYGPAPEPMLKNFETIAAGCAVFMDDAPDFPHLGLVDGATAIIYEDFDELVDKLRFWLPREDDLRRIGAAAARLAAGRHTWQHRAKQLQAVIIRHLSAN